MDKTITWRKSTRSGSESNCVELSGALEAVRDSKNADGPVLTGEIAALVAAVKSGTISA
jgi:hypothetical protein